MRLSILGFSFVTHHHPPHPGHRVVHAHCARACNKPKLPQIGCKRCSNPLRWYHTSFPPSWVNTCKSTIQNVVAQIGLDDACRNGSGWWRSSRTKPGSPGKGEAPEVWITTSKELVVKVSPVPDRIASALHPTLQLRQNATCCCFHNLFTEVYVCVCECESKQFVAPVDAQLGALAHAALNCSSILDGHLVSTQLRGDRIVDETASESRSADKEEDRPSAHGVKLLVSRERVEHVIWLGGVWVRKFKRLKKRNIVNPTNHAAQVRFPAVRYDHF
eukprot:1041735-Prorocentrum_minimum.AAC.1